ncbi:MAG: sigma-E factor regulatory protein RseB domain-containing protein [Armatimonadota bacterium]|jgi:negative regulator of sigma E activity
MNRPKTLLILIIALLFPTALCANDLAVEIARRAQNAEKTVSYRGIKSVYVTINEKTSASTVKIVHKKPDLTRREFFSPSQCAGAVLIERGPNTWKYDPATKCWEQMSWMISNEYHPRVFDNYALKLIGSDKVAGRDAHVLLATPKHGGSRRYKMWVDKQNYLTLKLDTQTASGKTTTSAGFTRIAVEPRDIFPTAFSIPANAHKADCPSCVDFVVRKPAYVPKGYRMIGIGRGIVDGRCYAHLQYSNGANIISLFERKSSRSTTPPQTPQKIDTVMSWVNGGVLFTLIGEVSSPELKKIAASIK